jgi:integrase
MSSKRILPNLYRQHHVYYYVTRVDGKVKWIRLSADYQEALHKYADLRSDVHNDGTVSSAIFKYRTEVLPKKAKKTQSDRAYQLDRLDRVFGSMPMDAVKASHMQAYLTEHEHEIAANREVKLLGTIYRHARVWWNIKDNPCEDVFYHKETPRDREVTDAEFIMLQEKASESVRAIIQVAYLTGMRRGDILDLKLTDLEELGIRNRQNKTKKKQIFKWTPALRATVKLAISARKVPKISDIHAEKWLFTNRKAEQVTVTGFNSAWSRLRKKCNLEDMHFHDIRSKAISDARRKGGLDYAQLLAGHENQSQTEAYLRSKSTDVVEPVK